MMFNLRKIRPVVKFSALKKSSETFNELQLSQQKLGKLSLSHKQNFCRDKF